MRSAGFRVIGSFMCESHWTMYQQVMWVCVTQGAVQSVFLFCFQLNWPPYLGPLSTKRGDVCVGVCSGTVARTWTPSTFDFSVQLSSCEHSRIVGVATRLLGGRSGGSNSERDKRFLFPLKRPERLWAPHSLLFGGYCGQNGRNMKLKPSYPADAEVKNEWSDILLLPICLYGVDRENYLTSKRPHS